jgi:hypothetical protein
MRQSFTARMNRNALGDQQIPPDVETLVRRDVSQRSSLFMETAPDLPDHEK